MDIVSGIAVYFMLWWLVIFAVLPWGVTRQQNGAPGTDAGAPQFHNMKKKMIATSIITLVLWSGVYYLVQSDVISFRQMASEMEMK